MPLSQLLFSTKGRIPRSTYWYFVLAFIVVRFLALLIDGLLGMNDVNTGFGLFSWIAFFLGLVIYIFVLIKRCHDLDHSGWYLLLLLVPFLNILVGFELGFFRGTRGNNSYGSDPLVQSVGWLV